MLQVHVRPYVTDPVERVGLQDAIAEGVGPNSTNDGENVVYCLRGQALLEQLCLKQLDIALADVDNPTLAEFFFNVHSLAHVVDDGARRFERTLNLQPSLNAFLYGSLV